MSKVTLASFDVLSFQNKSNEGTRLGMVAGDYYGISAKGMKGGSPFARPLVVLLLLIESLRNRTAERRGQTGQGYYLRVLS